MKTVLYFAAPNPKGSSGQIVLMMKEKLTFPVVYKNVLEKPDVTELADYDQVIFLTATYGDQELQEDIEGFLISIVSDLTGKRFAICELGNYYGYDDYSFGSGQIIENHLLSKNAVKSTPTFSIDSLPKLDWVGVEGWIDQLNRQFGKIVK